MNEQPASASLIENSSDIVRSYVTRNSVAPGDLARLIGDVHRALVGLERRSEVAAATVVLAPAVSIKKSITPDYLICLDDGKRFKSMKRHLGQLGMTPDEYRAKWSLPSSYPMVAANYSEKRSALAKVNGLGRKVGTTVKRPGKAKS